MAVSFGGVLFDWKSGKIIGLSICSGLWFILLGVQQEFTILTTVARRVFPVQNVRNKEMTILFYQIAAANTNSFIAIYFILTYFQFVQSDQALKSGVRLLPYIIPLVFATMLNGATMEKLKYYMPWFLVGGILVIVSNAMLYYIDTTVSVGYTYGALVIGGIGTGLFVNAPFAIAQWLVPPEEISLAVGFITCAQVAGVTNSLAIANAVLLNLAENSIAKSIPGVPKSDVQAAISGVGGSFLKTLDPAIQAKVLKAIIQAIQRVSILGITAGALAVILALFMNRGAIDLNSQSVTKEMETPRTQGSVHEEVKEGVQRDEV